MAAPTPKRLQRKPKTTTTAKRTTTRPKLPPELEAMLRGRCGGRCECCGKPLRARHRHHRKLRSQGGQDDVMNLVMICPACHHTIHMNPAWSRANGWLVDREREPARVLLLLHDGRRARLTTAGGYKVAE